MRRILALGLLILLLVGAWLLRDDLIGFWHAWRSGDEPAAEASPELAEQAERKLAQLSDPEAPDRVALTSAEVQSLVTYRMMHALPPFILRPRIRVEGGAIEVLADVPTDQVAGMRGIGGSDEILSMLPDTTEVQAHGRIIPLGGGRVGLAIDDVSAASIPLPDRIIPRLLERVGRVDEPGLPAEALAVRLPAGAVNAYIHDDSIVFLSRAASAEAVE